MHFRGLIRSRSSVRTVYASQLRFVTVAGRLDAAGAFLLLMKGRPDIKPGDVVRFDPASKKGGTRRDLEDLRAAIGHHAAEGYHREIAKVSLPEKGEPRDKWLTRSDAAKLIWTCWRYREMQRKSRRPMENVKVPTSKRPLRHLARFILLGIYSGTRESHRSRISHPVARSLLHRSGTRTLLPSEAGQRGNQAATHGSDPLALAFAPAALAPDRSRGEALRRIQRQAGDLSQDGIQECR
jgi:hypothetical protein